MTIARRHVSSINNADIIQTFIILQQHTKAPVSPPQPIRNGFRTLLTESITSPWCEPFAAQSAAQSYVYASVDIFLRINRMALPFKN